MSPYIDCLEQLAHQLCSGGPAAKTFRLLHVDFLLQVCIEEGLVKVGLLNVETMLNCHLKQQTQGCEADGGAESIEVVKVVLLGEAFCA